jgi:hypothetical protein
MRPMGGSCALSALCALWVGFGSVRPGFRPLLAEEPTRAKAQKNACFEKSGPQRLKPNSLHSSYVRPKGRTLQRSGFSSACKAVSCSRHLRHGWSRALLQCLFSICLTPSAPASEVARPNRLVKNSGLGKKDVPQGLKPNVFSFFTARLKLCPDMIQNRVFQQPVKPCPSFEDFPSLKGR